MVKPEFNLTPLADLSREYQFDDSVNLQDIFKQSLEKRRKILDDSDNSEEKMSDNRCSRTKKIRISGDKNEMIKPNRMKFRKIEIT